MTNKRCEWKVDYNHPSQLSRGIPIGVEFFGKNRRETQVVRKRILPVVNRSPQNITWLPIPRNMPMQALQSKTYIPFLGDEAVDSGFVDELMDLTLDGHDGRDDITTNIMDDEMFIKLVEALTQYQKRDTNTATSFVIPEPIIFRRISEYFPGMNNADYLCEK